MSHTIICYTVLDMINYAYTKFFLFIGTFGVQIAVYSVISEQGVYVECELVPQTQAWGCHVELDCDLVEQDFFTLNLPTARGCLLHASSASTFTVDYEVCQFFIKIFDCKSTLVVFQNCRKLCLFKKANICMYFQLYLNRVYTSS